MAQHDLKSLTIAFHGNNDFSSKKIQEMLGDASVQHSKYRFHFRYTKDLNLFHQYADLDFDNSLTLTKLKESRFVILIGLDVIFSSSMLSLIYSIPERYGLDHDRENFFWDRAMIVFDVGVHPDHDQVIQLAFNNNSGFREVVERVGRRYTYVSQFTNREHIILSLSETIQATESNPPLMPRVRHLLLYPALIGLLLPVLVAFYVRDLYKGKPDLPNKVRGCDRTFILFGKSNSGKSALGNLILGPHATTHFSTHPLHEPSGHTEEMRSGEAEIDARIVYGEGYTGYNRVKIQVIDQPGCNDNDHAIFSNQCLEMSKSKIKPTFLIVIDFTSRYFSQDEFLSIMRIAEILSENKYCFFSNAIIVSTHADMLDTHLRKDKLREIVHQKLQQEDFGYIHALLDLVDHRYMFVNAVNNGDVNRSDTLDELFRLTKPNLNVCIDGNTKFIGRDLKLLLGSEVAITNIKKDTPIYDVEYHFNLDFNPITPHDIKLMKGKITHALDKLNKISKGISAFVILINLEENFREEIYNHILNLPDTYSLTNKSKHFWDYACIVFKVGTDSKKYVRREIDVNLRLKNLDKLIQSRYCWITDRLSPEECYERLGNLVKEVISSNNWETYTDSIVVTEVSENIQEWFTLKYSKDVRIQLDVHWEDALTEAMPYHVISLRNDLLSINHRFWGAEHTGISTLIGYFIWKNIDADVAKRWKKQHPISRITKEQCVDFFLDAFGTI